MNYSTINDSIENSSSNPKIVEPQLITNTNEFNTYTSLHSTSNINDNNNNPQLQSDKENVYSSEILSDNSDTTKENLITDSEEFNQNERSSAIITDTKYHTEEYTNEESKEFSYEIIESSNISISAAKIHKYFVKSNIFLKSYIRELQIIPIKEVHAKQYVPRSVG
jgi:hypothetical protein